MTEAATQSLSGPSIEIDPDARTATLDDIYLDGTIVLVGCGKAKRDPEDPTDLHAASVPPGEHIRGQTGPTGPAWPAKDLYTSTYFAAKRELAETVTTWAGEPGVENLGGWAILSAEHYVIPPWRDTRPYDTTIADYGDDPINEDHWAGGLRGQRRPDGEEIVTEMDQWAAMVAYGIARWVATFRQNEERQQAIAGDYNRANTLLVLAGQDYVEPLRERRVFELGIDRMTGDPNHSGPGRDGLGVRTRFLFEEIDASGIGEQMAWLSDATDRLEKQVGGEPQTEQAHLPGGGQA